MKASILMITIDRFDITTKCFEKNIKRALSADMEIEVLVCDNGSNDRRIVDYFKNRKLAYHRVNSKNEGVAHAFNQLYLRATGDLICLLGNDIEMPEEWLKEAWAYIKSVPRAGIIGFDWGHTSLPEMSWKNGVHARWLTPTLNRVFGSWVVERKVIQKLGLFHEGYGPYGIEDSDFNERVNRAGYNSFYHPTLKSSHLVHDVGEKTQYRKMKDDSLSNNLTIFGHRVREFDSGPFNKLIEPLPPMRDPV